MKIKKVLLVASFFPLLVSCAQKGYEGKYVFQMGKSKDTHIGISLELTGDLYKEDNPELGKKFVATADLNTGSGEFSSILDEFNPVTGYYRIDQNETIYDSTRLNLGLNILGEYELPSSITDLIFVANINKNIVNFYVPVSFADLTFQLYWYGYDINMAEYLEDDTQEPLSTKEGKHDLGTHPTKEDIDKINEHYPNEHDGKVFRDYHVLKLGLTKL